MIIDHKQYELFGKTLLRKMVLKPPFTYTFPQAETACFLYMLNGEIQYELDKEQISVPAKHSLLLQCVNFTTQMGNYQAGNAIEMVIVHFHPGILKNIYDRELPVLLQSPKNGISNQSVERISNDFLIQKYIEGLLFYFENPSLVTEEILVLKVKEIVLLLAQTKNANNLQLVLSQLFSPATYTFKQIVEAHLFSQLTIEELAQKNNLSVSSFKREFTKLYNDTPANYIKNKKLEKAAELLLLSDERITDIAFTCGFNDLANFSKSFSDKYHVTPTTYRLNGIAK
jgi:AraC family transcriptional regulator, exoenzyme S synthesis regulatory protein ExsA